MPAFAGMTEFRTSYESVNIDELEKSQKEFEQQQDGIYLLF